MQPSIHFAHANGFPGACYAQFTGALGAHCALVVEPMLAHDPRYLVTDGWPHLAAQLADSIRRQHNSPVIGLGHSLGGYLNVLAAARWPELFQGVILLDAPLTSRFQGSAMQFVKRMGLIDRLMPSGSARSRRRDFDSAEQAIEHFRQRPLFQHFTDACLRDYVRHGLRPHGKGLTLTFDADIETQIYRTFPHRLSEAAGRLRCPAIMIAGTQSSVIGQTGLRATRRHMPVMKIEGGHLFPFEHPRAAATAVLRACEALLTNLDAVPL